MSRTRAGRGSVGSHGDGRPSARIASPIANQQINTTFNPAAAMAELLDSILSVSSTYGQALSLAEGTNDQTNTMAIHQARDLGPQIFRNWSTLESVLHMLHYRVRHECPWRRLGIARLGGHPPVEKHWTSGTKRLSPSSRSPWMQEAPRKKPSSRLESPNLCGKHTKRCWKNCRRSSEREPVNPHR